MAQESYKNYYIGNKSESEKLISEYQNDIQTKRDSLFQEMLDKTGAIAWRESNHWGEDSFVTDLVFNELHPSTGLPCVKINDKSIYNGERVKCIRGKRNSKEGVKFNKPIEEEVNVMLKDLPSHSPCGLSTGLI